MVAIGEINGLKDCAIIIGINLPAGCAMISVITESASLIVIGGIVGSVDHAVISIISELGGVVCKWWKIK